MGAKVLAYEYKKFSGYTRLHRYIFPMLHNTLLSDIEGFSFFFFFFSNHLIKQEDIIAKSPTVRLSEFELFIVRPKMEVHFDQTFRLLLNYSIYECLLSLVV